jgi:hypothetical protein
MPHYEELAGVSSVGKRAWQLGPDVERDLD